MKVSDLQRYHNEYLVAEYALSALSRISAEVGGDAIKDLVKRFPSERIDDLIKGYSEWEQFGRHLELLIALLERRKTILDRKNAGLENAVD